MYNECRHIFTSGKKCQSPALKDQDFCYFHQSNRQRRTRVTQNEPSTEIHNLPPLEDADAIQLALSDVVLALAANRIDPRRAQIIIYGLQIASQNHRHRAAMDAKEPAPVQTVRETQQHEDGTLVGLPQQRPDPDEIPVKERPSLGAILLRQAEAIEAKREAERQAQQKAAEAGQPTSTTLPQIQAAAEAWELESPRGTNAECPILSRTLRKGGKLQLLPQPSHPRTRERSNAQAEHISTGRCTATVGGSVVSRSLQESPHLKIETCAPGRTHKLAVRS